jgi:predicted ester cyclase
MPTNEGARDAKEANRALGRQFFLEQDKLRGGPAPELCAPEYTATLGANPPMDRSAHEGFALAFYAGFPDMYHEIERVIVEGDQLCVRFVIHGTHTGSLFGIPASGRRVQIAAHVILRTRAGKVTNLVAVFDEAAMLRQIGVLPAG